MTNDEVPLVAVGQAFSRSSLSGRNRYE